MPANDGAADADLVPLETWLARLREAAASPRDLTLTTRERGALLELARLAAHTSERVAAPLSTFMAGIAAADLSAEERLTLVERLTASLTPRP